MAKLAIVDFTYPAGTRPELKVRVRMSFGRWQATEYDSQTAHELLTEIIIRFREAGIDLPGTIDLSDLTYHKVRRFR